MAIVKNQERKPAVTHTHTHTKRKNRRMANKYKNGALNIYDLQAVFVQPRLIWLKPIFLSFSQFVNNANVSK